jgi:hypothetical protein
VVRQNVVFSIGWMLLLVAANGLRLLRGYLR